MNDYIGGDCVIVARDRAGRVTHRAERNIYLPQPKWMALVGGKLIDVEKLEHVRYSRARQRIFGRTLRSANGSAEFDDGIVTFARDSARATRVTIVARQKFALPLFWQAVNMDLFPEIKNFLVCFQVTSLSPRDTPISARLNPTPSSCPRKSLATRRSWSKTISTANRAARSTSKARGRWRCGGL
jgi:hypothetical protein